MKKALLILLAFVMLFALTACGQSEAAKAADEAIMAIGDVTLESKDAIDQAQQLVDGLDQESLSQVKMLDTLEKAKEAYGILATEEAINNIGAVDIGSKDKIDAAEKLYSDLSDAAKEKVSNYNVLSQAREELKKVLKEKYDGALSRMNTETDEVNGWTFYLPKRMPYYNNERCTLMPYIGTSNSSNWMVLRYNYASGDWVFFESVIVSVDGEKYYKTFNYGDITHDNGGGMVGELIDVTPDDNEIEMLRAIVTSEKTIVRYQGDDYYDDYVLTDADKSAIEDVLIIYDYMNMK